MTARVPLPARETDVAILLPTLYSVRNIVHSSVLGGLEKSGVRTALLFKELPADSSPGNGLHELLKVGGHAVPGRAFVNSVIAQAFSRRNRIRSYDLYREWFMRRATGRDRLRGRAVDAAAALATSRPVLERLCRATEALYRRSHDLEPVRRHLASIGPRMLWSTTCTSALEYPYYLAARDLGIPVATSILSFDNLTSRSALPVYDHYLVWSEAMRRQLIELYPDVSDARVTVTGTAQFDFHVQPCRWTRAETLERLGLPANSRYFLYAASHISLAPAEPQLVGELAARAARDPGLSPFRILVRLHPQDDGGRWGTLEKDFGNVVVSAACDGAPDGDEWKLPRPEDQDRLVAGLLHAEACLNIASTMSLDAAVLDRPAIGIDFSSEAQAPRDIMYSEYGATHYEPLVRSGGVELARRWPELLELLRMATMQPGRRREERARMVREVCGVVDGHSADRIVGAVLGWLGGAAASAPARVAGGSA